MKPLEYTLRFNTPAFLGNAEQQAQWRTPPFKALIRQWWRVVRGSTDLARLREEEGQLFGAANDEGGGSQKSRVRIRLANWNKPQAGNLENAGSVCHPEVDNPRLRNCPDGEGKLVDAGQYLGYGPFQKPNAAIQAGESNTLRLAWPDQEPLIADTLQLIHWFGTLGGRSHNGWGSLDLAHDSIVSVIPAQAGIQNSHLLRSIALPLIDCLRHDWPHALGQSADGRLLVWQSTQTFNNWREAMQALAKAKIGFRRQFPLGAPGPFEQRHLLAYPVTHHTVGAWGNQSRLANQLRFKVARNADSRLVARVFHLPCALPRELAHALGHHAPTLQQQAAIWQTVHGWLDNTNQSAFQRI